MTWRERHDLCEKLNFPYGSFHRTVPRYQMAMKVWVLSQAVQKDSAWPRRIVAIRSDNGYPISSHFIKDSHSTCWEISGNTKFAYVTHYGVNSSYAFHKVTGSLVEALAIVKQEVAIREDNTTDWSISRHKITERHNFVPFAKNTTILIGNDKRVVGRMPAMIEEAEIVPSHFSWLDVDYMGKWKKEGSPRWLTFGKHNIPISRAISRLFEVP